MKTIIVAKIGILLLACIQPVIVLADRYGVCEPPDCGGAGDGGAGVLIVIAFFALAFGWLGGRDWAEIIYIPTLAGILPMFLLTLWIKGIWPWEYSLEQLLAAACLGYIMGWVILYLYSSWISKRNKY